MRLIAGPGMVVETRKIEGFGVWVPFKLVQLKLDIFDLVLVFNMGERS